jgi:hypothetical protein
MDDKAGCKEIEDYTREVRWHWSQVSEFRSQEQIKSLNPLIPKSKP